jgi:FKBP-type peptidyl-prolyl cis-trans isomerase
MAIALQHHRLAGAVRPASRRAIVPPARASLQQPQQQDQPPASRRDALLLAAALPLLAAAPSAEAITTNPLEFKEEVKRRRRKIDPSEYVEGPKGLRYYDIVVGDGQTAQPGDRVAVHFELRLAGRSVTIFTTRVGLGVTGGNPAGFDLGQPPGGPGAAAIEGLDLALLAGGGMRVGGLRSAIVPPALGWGESSFGEIQPNSTLDIRVELLSIKQSAFGSRVKIVEG